MTMSTELLPLCWKTCCSTVPLMLPQGYIFKCLVLSNEQPQTQRYLVYNDIKQKKQQILTLEKLESENFWHFYLKNHLNNESIVKILD